MAMASALGTTMDDAKRLKMLKFSRRGKKAPLRRGWMNWRDWLQKMDQENGLNFLWKLC